MSALPQKRTFRHSAVRAREELLELCHRHHGSNRVGNETILVGGMVHFIELFRTGFSVAAPLIFGRSSTRVIASFVGILLQMTNRLVFVGIDDELLTRNREEREHVTAESEATNASSGST
jgi:hypothetical protein